MYEIGSKLKDPKGWLWSIINVWEYECRKTGKLYLCLALIGNEGTPSAGHMGGRRFEVESKAAA
jgi:hypothetical protein